MDVVRKDAGTPLTEAAGGLTARLKTVKTHFLGMLYFL